MPTIHFLNVGDGDCSIIQHGSGRTTIIDICNGKTSSRRLIAEIFAERGLSAKGPSGNYGMRKSPTEPISYLMDLGISRIFRFILTHPDMDHMDGFKALCDEIEILNFWDSGVRKDKPDFSTGSYHEEDWDHYGEVRDGNTDVTVVTPKAGSLFKYANLGEPEDRGDCLHILAPDSNLVTAANTADDPNDASYVIVYRTCGGKIIFPGDAHDKTWEFILENYEEAVSDCAVLIAPHHGRDSDRSFDFLDVLNPKLTLFGCADSQHLAYDAWNNRRLEHITNNQTGNILLNATGEGIEVYVENQSFAQNYNAFDVMKKLHECFFIGLIAKCED